MTENEHKDDETTPGTDEEITAAAATEEPETAPDAAEGEAEEDVFVEPPSFEVDYKGDCAYEVKVSVPPANRKKKAEEMFDELKSEAEVPGFRRGKVPRRLLERKFSKVVQGEVDAKLVSAAFERLVEEKKLQPLAAPTIEGLDEEGSRPDDEPLNFTLKFEVAPRVELGKYRGIDVERPVITVDDKDVDETIEEQRKRFAVYETLEDGEAQEGDQVILDFKGTVDGEEFPGGSAENYPYVLGTRRFFPEFEEALQGSRAGQELQTTVTFPEDYGVESLRGKTAEFTLKVNEIKRRNMPEVNDELAKLMGYSTVDEMREKIREQLSTSATEQSDRFAEARALESVIKSSTFEMPKSLIERIANGLFEDRIRQLLSRRVPMAQIREHEERLRKEAEEEAVHEVQSLLVLNEIAEAEGLEVTEDDLEQEISAMATRAGLESSLVAQYLEEQDQIGSYQARILRSKAIKVVMDSAQITDKELEHEEEHDHDHEHGHDHDHDHDHEHGPDHQH